MDHLDHVLAVKTRLTTIKGYAQLIERELSRLEPPPERLGLRVSELNHEIARLVDLVGTIESSMTAPAEIPSDSGSATGEDHLASGR